VCLACKHHLLQTRSTEQKVWMLQTDDVQSGEVRWGRYKEEMEKMDTA
jgi:hypothetical protein